mmetsp:Transcript_7909/g.25005  ORF Transcript_7909/g.25005 Transcript_7909/m.25005 type:complete len:276 (+) Transcript_7909:315-1142(+)
MARAEKLVEARDNSYVYGRREAEASDGRKDAGLRELQAVRVDGHTPVVRVRKKQHAVRHLAPDPAQLAQRHASFMLGQAGERLEVALRAALGELAHELVQARRAVAPAKRPQLLHRQLEQLRDGRKAKMLRGRVRGRSAGVGDVVAEGNARGVKRGTQRLDHLHVALDVVVRRAHERHDGLELVDGEHAHAAQRRGGRGKARRRRAQAGQPAVHVDAAVETQVCAQPRLSVHRRRRAQHAKLHRALRLAQLVRVRAEDALEDAVGGAPAPAETHA